MSSTRRTATTAGVFFLVAAAASIPALGLFQPVLGDAEYVLGAGSDGRVLLGALLEIVTVVAVVGTGVALYPVVRRENHTAALGYALGRLMEGALIALGLVAVLAVVSLRQDAGGSDDGALVVVQEALVAVKDWTFLLGPNVALGVNTLLLAGLMYRSGLVSRWIAVLGLVGGPLILASGIAVLLGAYEQVSVVGTLAALPVFAWEMSLAVHLVVRGFRPTAALGAPPVRPAAPVG
ncbi:DUF4386 domain-containing protein [Blastococcus haudaquaticus]|uniref:DUF4386 domain-containing protein n=1 Tax=Blastococcus haudaquaticus TaxID=1938745 RepID=A0A286GHZ5_9ACTN|nr:DUF4386 domain-containing protein [Blastococcus haudaquaticus]SOD95157.1 protein of unknown function [Blastococcus haudaquaticus]